MINAKSVAGQVRYGVPSIAAPVFSSSASDVDVRFGASLVGSDTLESISSNLGVLDVL